GDADAKADFPGQRLGHARASESLEGQQESVLRKGQVRRFEPDGAVLHRWDPEARPGPAGLLRADDQLVPPTGAGLRSADQPDLLAAQPQRRRSDPSLLPK